MTTQDDFIARLNWEDIATQLDQEGYAVQRGLLNDSQVRKLAALQGTASTDDRVSLAAEELGRGDLFYFSLRLPALLEDLRTAFYQRLAPIANRWNDALDIAHRYPDTLDAFLKQNRKAGQTCAQSNLTRLRADDYQALHQRSDGEQVFPLQLVALLSAPGEDFTGGEFVMTEQRPRMQSRPMVLPMRRGDVAIIAVAQRPFKGSKGYYRVNLKHAISRVRSGERVGLELLFHDAKRADRVCEERTWTLIGADGKSYQSEQPGGLGGHRAAKLRGLDGTGTPPHLPVDAKLPKSHAIRETSTDTGARFHTVSTYCGSSGVLDISSISGHPDANDRNLYSAPKRLEATCRFEFASQ